MAPRTTTRGKNSNHGPNTWSPFRSKETYTSRPSPERQKYATQAHGAQFVEVKVDEELGIVKVTRVVEATAVGKIMNPKTSHSQEMGGVE